MKQRRASLRLASVASPFVVLSLTVGCSSSAPPVGSTANDASSQGSSGDDSGNGGGSGGSGSSSGNAGSSSSGNASNGGGSGGSNGGSGSSSGSSGSSSGGAGSSSSGGGSSDAGSSSGSSGSDSGTGGGDAGGDGGQAAAEAAWLDPMNQARAAVGEMPLHWDPIAAQVALAYASQCMFMHNPNAGTQYDSMGGTGGLGENIASGAPTETVAAAVASWLGEKANYDHATNTCATGQECGHYTQIVWSTTTGVGCAKVHCTTNSPFGAMYPAWDNSVCDFSPPGNYVGQPPY